jgi:hypothetical protein
VAWWTVDQVERQMGETFAVRVLDALNNCEPAVRLHDGVRLIDEDQPPRSA